MESLKNSNVSTIGALTLELPVNPTIVVFRHIYGQVELHVGEPSLPRSNGGISLANSYISKAPWSA
jgi:hypothetical protein